MPKRQKGAILVLSGPSGAGKSTIINASSNEIHQTAIKEGMVTIFEDGMQKALLGITTIEEVLRIIRYSFDFLNN